MPRVYVPSGLKLVPSGVLQVAASSMSNDTSSSAPLTACTPAIHPDAGKSHANLAQAEKENHRSQNPSQRCKKDDDEFLKTLDLQLSALASEYRGHHVLKKPRQEADSESASTTIDSASLLNSPIDKNGS